MPTCSLTPHIADPTKVLAILTDQYRETPIAVDMLRVFALLAGCHQYPDAMGDSKHFEAIVRAWRPAAEASGREETI